MILVTGGAGFIGAHLCSALSKGPHPVRVLDNFSSGKRENLAGLSNIEVVEADIRDDGEVRRALKGVDTVFHLAAMVSVAESMRSPGLCREINADGTEILARLAAESNVQRILFASSCAVYGNHPELPKTEESPVAPISPYAESKLAGEKIFARLADRGKVSTVSFRFFNVYGPRQDPNSEYAAVVARFISQARAGKKITIFGDGEATRDFVYIGDVVRAGEYFAERKELIGEYQVASGESTSVRGLAEAILQALEKGSSPAQWRDHLDFLPERPGDILHSAAKIEKLLAAGFSAPIRIADGLKKTISI